jgi:hypothetical protein
MGKNTDNKVEKSRVTYEVLEEVVRMKIKEFIQGISSRRRSANS